MVIVKPTATQEYSMDGYLQSNLDIAKKVIREDWDMVFIVDGTEGAGKSVITQQMATYCDPTFELDNIVFNPQTFKRAVRKASKFTAIVYDEAFGGLNSRTSMTTVNIALVKMLTEIRRKNLFIFILMPSYFDMDKYVALWRSRALIHVYADSGFKRGSFAFYGKEEKKILYLLGKKLYSYAKPRPSFIGTFPNHWTVDKEAYDLKKQTDTEEREDDTRIMIMKNAADLRAQVVHALKNTDLGLTQVQIASILNVTTMTVHRYLKKMGLEAESLNISKENELTTTT